MTYPQDFQELFQQLDNMQRGRANQQLGNLNRIGNEDAAAALKAISEARAAVKALIANNQKFLRRLISSIAHKSSKSMNPTISIALITAPVAGT